MTTYPRDHSDPVGEPAPPEHEDHHYIYRPDNYVSIYCSRCGEDPFEDFERRETHEEWVRAIVEHLACAPKEPTP